jgi:hypothetical protein
MSAELSLGCSRQQKHAMSYSFCTVGHVQVSTHTTGVLQAGGQPFVEPADRPDAVLDAGEDSQAGVAPHYSVLQRLGVSGGSLTAPTTMPSGFGWSTSVCARLLFNDLTSGLAEGPFTLPLPRTHVKMPLLCIPRRGEVREWTNRHAWKACVPATGPWVRIPPSPPCLRHGKSKKVKGKYKGMSNRDSLLSNFYFCTFSL